MKALDATLVLGRGAAVLGFLGAFLWGMFASWLCAHEFIGYHAETGSYLICCCAMPFALVCYLYLAPASRTWRKLFAFAGIFGGPLLVFTSCERSDETFMYWKMRQIPPAVWQQMVSDLKTLGNQVPKTDANGFPDPNQIPRSFNSLGLRKDFAYFNTGAAPLVVYGSHGAQGRLWGLTIGSAYTGAEVPGAVFQIRVADNAYFFVDPN